MKTIRVTGNETIRLGRAGENQAVQVIWPGLLEKWRELYGEGTVQLAARRPKDAAPYPVVCEVSENDVTWTVQAADTARHGIGECELTYLVGEKIAKSQTWATEILRSLTEDDMAEPPDDPAKTWYMEMRQEIGNLENLETADKSNLVAAINEAKQSGGGGTPYQQLVTDGEGNTKWEDRLCYKGEGYTAVLDSSQFTNAYTIGQNSGFSYNGQSYIIAAIDDKYAEQIPLLVMFLPGAEPFPVGAKCKVTFDDTIYNCEIVEDAEYCWHIGNMSIGQPSDYPDTGEPFCFEFGIPGYNLYIPGEYKGNGIYVYTLHGLKIEMASEIVVPIDPKWLPVVDSVTLNSSTNGSSKKFKITVDDNGTISATEVT